MAKKDKNPSGEGGGCPDYMMTYGDMMSLLLCFFVIIVSLSQIKEEEKFRAVMESLKKAFGYNMGRNAIPEPPSMLNPSMNMVDVIKQEINRMRQQTASNQKTKSPESQIGRNTSVRNIRDGLMMTIGGLALFEEGRADLLPEAQEELKQVAEIIIGYRNKVLIRGHASRAPLPPDSPFKNQMELSYARGLAVMNFLIEQKVKPERLNVEACGHNEPMKVQVFSEEGLASSRRVEIIVKDTMVEDYEGDQEPKTP
ncbi:MAG: flagellar motor protein MotB [Planctomycetes bacterium]|nr:flagellar motor protein MotB [Planctomycetota bacterium]